MSAETRSWTDPLEPWPGDAAAWNRFLRTIDRRIAVIRHYWGFDGRQGVWQTFNRPLSGRWPRPERPIGLVAQPPTNTATRDAHGRYRPELKPAQACVECGRLATGLRRERCGTCYDRLRRAMRKAS